MYCEIKWKLRAEPTRWIQVNRPTNLQVSSPHFLLSSSFDFRFTELDFQKQASAQENILFLKTILTKLKEYARITNNIQEFMF